MKLKNLYILIAALCCISCVTIDHSVGGTLIPINQQYDIYSAEFPLKDIRMEMADGLSGYSSTRLTIGAIYDEDFGLTTRAASITLVPFRDTLDFGSNAKLNKFYFTIAKDTTCVSDPSQLNIMQNVNVYELSEKVSGYDINTDVKHNTNRITKGIPIYRGQDSLKFEFTEEFAKKYMSITQDDLSSMNNYLKKFPGIYLNTDNPIANSGRINMFELQLDTDVEQGFLTGSFAELSFSAEYDGARKDTSFFFYFGGDDFRYLDSLIYERSQGNLQYLPQYCLNITGHESKDKTGKATETISVEGGGGLKPVISATEIKEKLTEIIRNNGGDPSRALINKATIELPYNYSEENYTALDYFPQYLNPTCRIVNDTLITFASLTDSSSETENPGTVVYSFNEYAPDITYHTQAILRTGEEAKMSNYDIWLLIMAKEVVKSYTQTSSSSDSMSDYYSALMYSNYYNNLYGGYGGYGYGGYGYGGYGYGGYGYNSYYNNYMTYALASMYASSSSSGVSTSTDLDTHRFYKVKLLGPENDSERKPMFKVIYSVPKE